MATSSPIMIAFATGMGLIYMAGLFLGVVMLLWYLFWPVNSKFFD